MQHCKAGFDSIGEGLFLEKGSLNLANGDPRHFVLGA